MYQSTQTTSVQREETCRPCENYGERRGERKRARARASALRREEQALQKKLLSVPPSSTAEAAARWDEFYRTKPTLFKDRHILRAAFPEIVGPTAATNPKQHIPPLLPQSEEDGASENVAKVEQSMELRTLEFLARNVENARSEQQDLILVEAGCGTGNAVYPLLRANERLFAYAFDFSHRAVELLRSSPEYRPDRIHAFQANLIEPSTYLDIVRASSPRGAHFVTALWTLSALTPHEQSQAASGLASLLAYDGVLLVRDYAAGDMRAEKFAKRGQHVCREAERLFLRGDGTYAYFFTEDELRTLFENVGLSCISCKYEERTVENRKEGLTMRRRWVQARFKRNGGGEGG